MTNLVQFPGLGLSFELDRVAFSIGSMNIYWYGVCIAVGMCLALAACGTSGAPAAGSGSAAPAAGSGSAADAPCLSRR